MQNNFFVNKRTLKEGQTHIDLLNGDDKDLFERYASKKKIVIMDCDGVLSTNESFYTKDGKVMKSYGCYDREMLSYLEKYCGWEVLFVSMDKNGFEITKHRVNDMHYEVKLGGWEFRNNIVKEYNDKGYITLFIGDSLSDINALSSATYAGTVNNAPDLVKYYCNYASCKDGGYGGLGEVLYVMHDRIKNSCKEV